MRILEEVERAFAAFKNLAFSDLFMFHYSSTSGSNLAKHFPKKLVTDSYK